MSLRGRTTLPLVAVCLVLAAPAPAHGEAVTSALGTPCVSVPGGQQCTATLPTRAPGWDGVPLDFSLTLPPASQDGPFPLILALHGWGFFKEAALADANPTALAEQGYAVLAPTSRGFGLSCGLPPSRIGEGCERGWVHLADARYEVRDVQRLAGLLADEGLVDPQRIGVTGSSYGGGQSFMLAALKDRIMLPSGRLAPWRSPQGKPMRIAAAAPRIAWTDLSYALVPNGDTLDFHSRNPYLLNRIGVPKQSWLTTLYTLGSITGHYAPAGADPSADITSWYSVIQQGDPYDDAKARVILREFTRHRSSYYVLDGLSGGQPRRPAPVLAYNAWTDDIFGGDEALRFYNRTRASYPGADISVVFADGFGHARASLTGEAPGFDDARDAFFARYLLGRRQGYSPLRVVTYTQGCNGEEPEGPFRTRTWHAQHPGEVSMTFPGTRSFSSAGGNQETADAVDPNAGGGLTTSSCRTVDAERDPAAANFELPKATGPGYTLLGAPTVAATIRPGGAYPQIQARLWDVAPDGKQTMVTRGAYTPEPSWAGRRLIFQLHPNGWHFRAGHVPKLELLGRDSPYGQASNTPFRASVSRLRLELPVRDRPDGGLIKRYAPPRLKPDRVRARVRPRRDPSSPHRFRVRGRIVLPVNLAAEDGCRGRVSIRVTLGGQTIARRRTRVRRNCGFSRRVGVSPADSGQLRVRVRFRGNKLLAPRRAKARRVRVG